MWAVKTPADYYLVETIKPCDSCIKHVTAKMNSFNSISQEYQNSSKWLILKLKNQF